MKKIIMLCSILVILLTLSVPTFAADVDDPYDLIGEWTFNSSISLPEVGQTISFSSNGIAFSSLMVGTSDGKPSLMYKTSSSDLYTVYTSNSWYDSKYQTIDITYYSPNSTTIGSFASWLSANAVKTVVEEPDQSTPVVPDNFVDYNGTMLPPITGWTDISQKTVLIAEISGASYGDQFANSYYYIIDVVPKINAIVTHNTGYVVYHYASSTYFTRQIYTPDPDLASVLTAEGNTASTTGWGEQIWTNVEPDRNYAVDRIVWSNYNIYNADGTLFFPNPPTTLTEIVTGVQMTGVVKQIVMMIPVGLACLIGFVALRKAWMFLTNLLQQP